MDYQKIWTVNETSFKDDTANAKKYANFYKMAFAGS